VDGPTLQEESTEVIEVERLSHHNELAEKVGFKKLL
jgi:hypothetical protein